MTVLSDYEDRVATDLLHDPNYTTWTRAQIDRFINAARVRLVKDTGCLRVYQTIILTPGVESYSVGQVTGAGINSGGTHYTDPTIAFSGGGGTGAAATLGVTAGVVSSITFTNLGSGYTSSPAYIITDGTGSGANLTIGVFSALTFDVLGAYLIWTNYRYAMRRMAFSELTRQLRLWDSTNQSQPVAWAGHSETTIFVAPFPDQSYPVDLDSVLLPADLSGSAIDPIPLKMQDAIPFYAAYLAKESVQSYGEGEMLLANYDRFTRQNLGAYSGWRP